MGGPAEGKTALQLATMKGHQGLCELLQSAAAAAATAAPMAAPASAEEDAPEPRQQSQRHESLSGFCRFSEGKEQLRSSSSTTAGTAPPAGVRQTSMEQEQATRTCGCFSITFNSKKTRVSVPQGHVRV